MVNAASKEHPGEWPHHQCRDVIEDLLLSGSGLWEPGKWWRRVMGNVPMERAQWRWTGMRPPNHPMRRVRGAAALGARMVAPGPLSWLASLVQDGRPCALVNGLSVTNSLDCYGTLVGRSRASDLAVNVALPGLHAAACLRGDAKLASLCLRLYRTFPALQEKAVTREARRLLGPAVRAVPTTACRQQGLHHLYRRMLEGAPRSGDLS